MLRVGSGSNEPIMICLSFFFSVSYGTLSLFLNSRYSGIPSVVSVQLAFFITVATNEYIIHLHFQHFLPFSSVLNFLQDVLALSQG